VIDRADTIELTNKLSFDRKMALIKTQFPYFDPENKTTAFDLISLDNRSKCIHFGREKKLDELRKLVASREK
jgi:hypothetical protein